MVAWLLHMIQENPYKVMINDPGAGVGDIEKWLDHRDVELSMHPAVYALALGLISGLSLPIGAWVGCKLSPVSDRVVGMMMAFGAGALLFAVTVELYAEALKEVHMGSKGLFELFATIFGALAGAAFYLVVNRWLEEYLKTDVLENYRQMYRDDPEADVEVPDKPQEDSVSTLDMQEQIKPGSPKKGGSTASEASESSTTIWTALMKGDALHHIRGREKALRALTRQTSNSADKAENAEKIGFGSKKTAEQSRKKSYEEVKAAAEAKSVAMALFLGLLIDGVPEGILIGFLAAEGHLTWVLVISLFLANFPEAFSSASLLVQAEMEWSKIMLMWTSLMVLVGGLGGLSCWLLLLSFPAFGHGGLQNQGLPMSVLLGLALVEGITGGAMIACIAAVMLPESFERAGKDKSSPFYHHSGFMCTAGFLFSVVLKALLG